MTYHWDWGLVWQYKYALLDATWVTIWLNLLIVLIGSFAGILVALMGMSKNRMLQLLAKSYTDLFRTLPVLVMLVWFFFCVPVIAGIQMSPVTAAIIVLSLNLSAFTSEIIRAGIENIPRHHLESAQVIGLSQVQTFRYITLPIALQNMVPPLVGQYINTIKLSVLASVISVPELLYKTSDLISQTYRPLEFYTALAVMFLFLLLPLTWWSRKLEHKAATQQIKLEAL